ncbi:hypothetical protein PR048_000569 [Dryococelus australis]|uniref:DUF4371 domain-containing protein n=1 Tax=Dryococelus australis TaxID=614101 RepID=A0ABQ9IF06_9NEOP|nr:hypothetical protein PR048_000569 [Dryococelus australis]
MTHPPLTRATLATSQQSAQCWFGEAQKNEKVQSSLLSYFCPGPPPSKKQWSLEDEPPEGGTLRSSPAQSSTFSYDNTFSKEGCRSISSCSPQRSSLTVCDTLVSTVCVCSSSGPSSIEIINNLDPGHCPALAIAHVKEGSFQPIDLILPVKDGRKYRSEWYKTFPWLEYSSLNNKAYCFVCRAFYQPESKTKADDAFKLSEFLKWKKALASLKESDKSGTVAEEVQQNVLYLQVLCKSLVFCGRQSIALRYHDESTDSKNKGNFLDLMELRSKDSNLIKEFYLERQQFFAIIADETQDIAKHEEVAVVLRHVNEDLEVHESFVGFYRAGKADSETLANLLKNVLLSLELDIKNLRAQCYDGASNMRCPHKGVAARIVEDNPTAMYIHCNAHVLNVCIVACFTGVTSIRNTFFVLQSLYNFIEKSTKRHAVFEKIQRSTKNFCGETVTLKSLSDTRWDCRVEAVRSLLNNFEPTLLALQEILQTDPDNGGQANAV